MKSCHMQGPCQIENHLEITTKTVYFGELRKACHAGPAMCADRVNPACKTGQPAFVMLSPF